MSILTNSLFELLDYSFLFTELLKLNSLTPTWRLHNHGANSKKSLNKSGTHYITTLNQKQYVIRGCNFLNNYKIPAALEAGP